MFLSADISQNALLLWPHQRLSTRTNSSSYVASGVSYVLIQTHVRENEHYVTVDFTLPFTLKACVLAGAQDAVQLYAASAERQHLRGSNSWSISWNESEQPHLLPDDNASTWIPHLSVLLMWRWTQSAARWILELMIVSYQAACWDIAPPYHFIFSQPLN